MTDTYRIIPKSHYMNIRDLHYLIAVAQFKHFKTAAEHCHVSQPTLSMQLKKLESELGVTLFERTNKEVFITTAGQEILEHAQSILDEVNTIKSIASQAQDPFSGRLKLGLIPTLAPYLLPIIMPKIRKNFPKLDLYLIEDKTENLIRMLAENKIDSAIMAHPIDYAKFDSIALFDESFYFICCSEHPLAAKKIIHIEDIPPEELLLLTDGHCMREHAMDICRLSHHSNKTDFSATSLETLRHMVASNMGVSLLPALSLNMPIKNQKDYKIIPLHPHNQVRKIALFIRKKSPVIACVASLADLIRVTSEHILTNLTARFEIFE